ncbi:unnamed protein product [Caenorhabditis sp. 36 PRJEB53466]|nr:unnamed protein product [Caenorhabditis sp. 36 PRJEB53466]
MQTVVVLALLVASAQAFLFGPGGLGGLGSLFGAPAGGCDPCAAARASYYPPQPVYQQPAYQPPVYQQPAPVYQTAPVQTYQPQPAPAYQTAPAQYQTVAEPQPIQPAVEAGAGSYAQAPPPPPPPASYATGPAASVGYKKFF